MIIKNVEVVKLFIIKKIKVNFINKELIFIIK